MCACVSRLCVCMHTYMHACVLACVRACMLSCMVSCVRACVRVCMTCTDAGAYSVGYYTDPNT